MLEMLKERFRDKALRSYIRNYAGSIPVASHCECSSMVEHPFVVREIKVRFLAFALFVMKTKCELTIIKTVGLC